MIPHWIIEKKRDGKELTKEEIRFFINGYTKGAIPDYQASAFAMAVYFRGMTKSETSFLTEAMMNSGETIPPHSLPSPSSDKHSTGGVGDKISLILAPLVASCGVYVPMLSGRGLGITGGTLDKLESIPGYRTNLSKREFISVIKKCGCSITGQTENMVPADRKLYALRDVTATVPSIPLIAASIMSKKLAEGAQSLVLDVKWGSGAFMKKKNDAALLARTMIDIGKDMNRKMTAILSNMDQPLGRTAGNALEVQESIDCLKNEGPSDVMKLTFALSAHMLIMTGIAKNINEAENILQKNIMNGAALERFMQMIKLHKGNPRVIENYSILPKAKYILPLLSPESGWITKADADIIGRACIILGAGRETKDDKINFAVGISGIRKIGERIERKEPLLFIHADDKNKIQAAKKLLISAFCFSDKPVHPPQLIGGILNGK